MPSFLNKVKKFTKNNLKWIILLICVVLITLYIIAVSNNDIEKNDLIIYNFINSYIISDWATPIIKFITNFGGTIILISMALFLLITVTNKKMGLFICLNLILSSLSNVILKQIFQRERPLNINLIEENGYSFPSGHAMISLAFYGFIIYLVYKHIQNKYLKYFLIIILILLILLIGISRVYLGVHYVSDVISGYLFSVIYLIIYINIINKYISNKK